MMYILIRGAEKWGVNTEFLSNAYVPPPLNSLEDISWMDWYKDIICDDTRISDIFLIFRKKERMLI